MTVTDERLRDLWLMLGDFDTTADDRRDIRLALRELQSARAQLAALQRDHAAEAARVVEALRLLDEVTFAHRDKGSPEYNECDVSQCHFCEQVAALAQPDAARPAGEMT